MRRDNLAHLLRTPLPLAAAFLSACLTVEGIPVKDEDGDDDVDGAIDEQDAGREMRDAALDARMPGDTVPGKDAEVDSGVPIIPCFDRGTYELDGVSFRGMRQTCDGDLVCVEGQCVPLPACAPGVTHECLHTPQGTHGDIVWGSLNFEGDYIYWLELGAVDDRNNPLYDGALARTKVGEWTREEIVVGLDFFDEANRGFHGPDLRVDDGYAIWSAQPTNHVQAEYISLAETPFVTRKLAASHLDLWCWSDGIAYRADKHNLHRQALDGSEPILLTSQLVDAAGCVVSGDKLVVRTHADAADQHSYRVELTVPPTVTELTPSHRISAVTSTGFWTMFSNEWIGSAQDEPSGALTWQNVAGPVNASWIVEEPYVLWNRHTCDYYSRSKVVVVRSPTNGEGKQEVIAEIIEDEPCYLLGSVRLSSFGSIWSPTPYWITQTSLHFAPMPPPLPAD